MDINKAIRKQTKSYKRFMLSMGFIAILFPLILFLSGLNTNIFFVVYLVVLEFLILIAMFSKVNHQKLNFESGTNKLKISVGIIRRKYLIFCERVTLVHTEKNKEDMAIIIVTTLKVRNKKIRAVSEEFCKRYPGAASEYLKIKNREPSYTYYYIVIKKGGFKKYLLLDVIYRNCVKAIYTENAIENLRFSRGVISL